MSNRITVLRTGRHREFLAEQRQDPVTRKVFVAGDRVTLCASCLLPFLEESWDAVGGTHCGQSATVALQAYETGGETPAAEAGVDSGEADADGESDTRPGVAPDATDSGLRPVPVKLREVPVRLRRA